MDWLAAGANLGQVTTVLSMVAFGALLQWRIAPSKGGAKAARRPLVIHD